MSYELWAWVVFFDFLLNSTSWLNFFMVDLMTSLKASKRWKASTTHHKWLTLNDFQRLRPACVALWQRTPPRWERFKFEDMTDIDILKTWPIFWNAFHLPASSRKLLARLPVCKDKAWFFFTALQSSKLKRCISENMSNETWKIKHDEKRWTSCFQNDWILWKVAKQSKRVKHITCTHPYSGPRRKFVVASRSIGIHRPNLGNAWGGQNDSC